MVLFEEVQKSYDGETLVVKNLNLSLGRGEFMTMLGPSGSGKTTCLMMVAGFETATHGEIYINGKPINSVPPHKRGIGMVFQNYALFPHMTIAENLAFPLEVRGINKADATKKVQRALDMVQMGDGSFHGRRPAQLSGGQQQRVALARALAYEPPVLLLDEPFSALDKNLRGQMQDEMRRIHRETGTTFVFVTHDQEEALALSSRVAIFEKGRLQQIAPPREVYERPANRFVAEFLGDINILPVQDGRIEGRPIEAARASGDLAIRPEYMQLSLTEPGGGNAVAAVLDDITYLGAETRLSLRSAGGVPLVLHQQTARLPESIAPGSAVWATWAAADGFLL